jgi:hypothetical protein
MRDKGLIQDGEAAGTRSLVLGSDFSRTRIEISWWEVENQTTDCHRVDIQKTMAVPERVLHSLRLQPVQAVEQGNSIA